jgi:hypothetical protein
MAKVPSSNLGGPTSNLSLEESFDGKNRELAAFVRVPLIAVSMAF